MSVVRSIVDRLDAWQNALTGLGTLRDKSSHHKPVPEPQLSDGELEAMFSDDDVCARIVEQLPHDAVRQGFGLKLDSDQDDDSSSSAKDIVQAIKKLDGLAKLRQAWIWARLYRLGAVLVGADDSADLRKPLEIERVKEVRFLTVLRNTQLQVASYYDDPRAPKFGEPQSFRIIQLAAGSSSSGGLYDVEVHESRMLVFKGVTTARLPVLSGGIFQDADSVLQRIKSAVQSSSESWMSAAHLMTDASQGVLAIQNLMQLLSTGGESLLRKRMQMMDIARSVCRSILIDAEKEKFERVTTSFAGIPELLDRQMMRVSSAARMPVTILYGRSPAGMNATGESDTRAWYDIVAAERREHLEPQLEQLIRIVMATAAGPTGGEVLEGWSIVWPALWQATDKEQAETFKLESDALVGLVNAQVVLPEEAALKLANKGCFAELDVDAREQALRVELERIAHPHDPNDPNDPHDPEQPPARGLGAPVAA
jgi:uncharacterized protein